MQAGFQRLMNAENLVAELDTIAAESPELANLLLHFSVAARVKTQSVQGRGSAVMSKESRIWREKIELNRGIQGVWKCECQFP